jgi:hypothetical protein
VDSVELFYESWDVTGALWCRRIDLGVGEQSVTLLLAEGTWDDDTLAPSADNIAVVSGSEIEYAWHELRTAVVVVEYVAGHECVSGE